VPPHLRRPGGGTTSFIQHARECLRRRGGLRPLSTSGGSLCSTGRRLLVSFDAVRRVYEVAWCLANRFPASALRGDCLPAPTIGTLTFGGGPAPAGFPSPACRLLGRPISSLGPVSTSSSRVRCFRNQLRQRPSSFPQVTSSIAVANGTVAMLASDSRVIRGLVHGVALRSLRQVRLSVVFRRGIRELT